MAGFKVDYSKATSTHNVPDGEYEVTITSAGWNKTAGGTEYIQLKLQVRNDVLQPEKGETIEYPLWKSRPENAKDSDIEGVPAWKIHQISKAVELDNGADIDGIDGWFKLIQWKPMRVSTKQDDQGRAKVGKVEESKFPKIASGFVPVVDDGDVPF